MFLTTAATSGQRGALFGRPAATSLWNIGLERALECLPPTQIASLECSGSLICIGGQGGKQAPQQTHFFSSTSSDGLPLTMAGRIAATGQRATTVGRSQTLATMSWLIFGGLVCWMLMAISPWPPQLIWQQEVVICTRLGISSLTNSLCSSSISAFTTPEASVPGMSQCSQPWVWEIMVTEGPVPPTGKPSFVSFSISGATFFSSLTMNSMLERMVKRTWPSANLSAMQYSL